MPDVATPATTAPPHDPVRTALDDESVQRNMRETARHLVRRPEIDPDDVMQTATLRALANAHRFNPDLGSVTAWLTGFVRNVAREQANKKGNRTSNYDELDRLPAVPEDKAGLADQRAALSRRLDELPEQLRRAVELRHLSELDYPAMAATLGTTEATARQRVSRGIQMLRTQATKEAS